MLRFHAAIERIDEAEDALSALMPITRHPEPPQAPTPAFYGRTHNLATLMLLASWEHHNHISGILARCIL